MNFVATNLENEVGRTMLLFFFVLFGIRVWRTYLYLFSPHAFVLRFVEVYVIGKLLINEICKSSFIASGIMEMLTWRDLEFHEIQGRTTQQTK